MVGKASANHVVLDMSDGLEETFFSIRSSTYFLSSRCSLMASRSDLWIPFPDLLFWMLRCCEMLQVRPILLQDIESAQNVG